MLIELTQPAKFHVTFRLKRTLMYVVDQQGSVNIDIVPRCVWFINGLRVFSNRFGCLSTTFDLAAHNLICLVYPTRVNTKFTENI